MEVSDLDHSQFGTKRNPELFTSGQKPGNLWKLFRHEQIEFYGTVSKNLFCVKYDSLEGENSHQYPIDVIV